MANDVASDVRLRLEAIRQALISGDILSLVEEEGQLRQALQAAEGQIAPAERAELRRLAHENEALLRATRQGIRSALRRMAEIRDARVAFGTYDSGGRRKVIPHRPPETDRSF
jgi:hypothetical protein